MNGNTFSINKLTKSLNLNQYWITINKVLMHWFQGNVYLNIQDINPEVVFEIYTPEIAAVSLRGRWVE